MIKSLRRKFILIAMSSTFAVLAVIMASIHIYNYKEIVKSADQLLAILGDNQGEFPREAFGGENGKADEKAAKDGGRGNGGKPDEKPAGLPGTALSPETPYETRFFSALLDDNGEPLETKTGNIAAVAEEDAVEYARDARNLGREKGFCAAYRYKVVREEEGCLVVFVDCTKALSSFYRFLATSIAVSLIGLFVVLLLLVIFSKMIFRPVVESYDKQKRFITDASHELKTPLTIIDANTEVLEMVQGGNEWTASIRNQVKRLTSLTQQMVTLTRMDEGKCMGPVVEFSLSDAVEETAELFVLPAQSKGKRIEVQVEKGISHCGDEDLIRQMVSLLLDNAVKYSDEKSCIRVSLQKKGKKAILQVFNPVEQIETGNLDIIFERFYRRDASRNSQTGGSGIGLSVVKAIVELHGGKIHAASRDGRSIEITAVL